MPSACTRSGAPASNFHILEGDITQAEVGFLLRSWKEPQGDDRALHLAAIYDLAVARDTAMRVNVEGTRNVNRFAPISNA